MNPDQLLQTVSTWTGANTWIVQVFVVVFVALALDLVQRVVLRRLYRHLERTENPWDDALLHAVQKPLTLLIWVVGMAFAAEIASRETGALIFNAIDPVRNIVIIAAFTWFMIRMISNFQANVISKGLEKDTGYDRTTAEAMGKLLRLSVLITAVLVALQTLGFSVSGVLAFGGVGGIAVGFAAKDLLANFFGGLMVYLDRPFAVGDWIRSPDREIEGTVEDIGWRLTRIRSFDKRPIYVPNSAFASIAVVNPSRMTHRRIHETVGVRYADADRLEGILKDVRSMLEAHPEIDTSQTLMVNFNSFAPSSLDFFVYTFTKTTVWTRYHEVKQDVLFRILNIIADHGAEVAFPTSTVHIPDAIDVKSEVGMST